MNNWENIGTVAGAGFSNNYLLYDFYDLSPISGISYYKLKQVDYDGAYEYSEIIPVNYLEKHARVKKYYDLTGREVYELRWGVPYVELDGSKSRKIMVIK